MRIALNRKRILLFCSVVFLAVLPVIASLLDEPFLVSLFSRILVYGLAAVSLDLLLGYGGMVSFGHAAFFGVGGYVVGILSFHSFEGSPVLTWPLTVPGTESALIAWPAAVLVAASLAVLIGAICLRTAGMHFIMITLAFAQMLFYFFVSLGTYGGEDGLSLWSRNTLPFVDLGEDLSFYYVCLAVLIGFLVLTRRLVDSRFGMVIRGIKQNPGRMGALGFPTYRYRLATFVIAAAGAGLAGALIANQTEFVSPGLFHWTRSGEILVMVILGGMGTLYGPVFGAATLLLMEEILSVYTEYWMAFLGPFLIVVVLFARRGVYGLLAGTDADDG